MFNKRSLLRNSLLPLINKDKRGISAIVATVMIILITVAAVGILWAAIIPMIQTNLDFSSLQGRVSVLNKGYTAYDSNKNIASVQVKRDVDEGVMNRIKIIFEVGGNSYSSSVIAPQSGGTRVYYFSMEGIGEPDSVSAAPVFAVGNKEKEGEITSTVDIPKSKISGEGVFVQELGEEYFGDSSCLEILGSGKSTGNGAYTIDPDGKNGEAPFEVYCDMTSNGGGWTLLMKATRGNTFNYNSNYWTVANTLNENDVSRNDADAKYRSFNELGITDIMARWPDAGDIRWLKNSAWSERTALQGFNEYRDWGIPQEQPDWNPAYFSAQAKQCDSGPGRYGTKLKDIGGYNAGARWGYRFNENGCNNWASDDVGGGIGVWTDRNSNWRYSAGDWYHCCQSSAGMKRSARVEVYGR